MKINENYVYFLDVNKPTMNELICWFMVENTDLCDKMQNSRHAVTTNEPNPYHTGDNSIWTHTMMVCQRAEIDECNKIVLLAALLHDLGKPMAREEIPFEAKKPVHSESNELRNEGLHDGKTSGLQKVVPPSGKKVHMRGHEGLSFYLAVKVLNSLKEMGVVNEHEMIEVLSIISMHGTLFDSIDKDGNMRKPEKVFAKFPLNERGMEFFKNFVQQVKNDSLGRFFVSKDGRKNQATYLGTEIFTASQFAIYCMEHGYPNLRKRPTNANITVLIGPPAVGKTTWREANVGPDDVVVSRDDIMEQYAVENSIIGTEVDCHVCKGDGFNTVISFNAGPVDHDCYNCKATGKSKVKNYSELWKYLEDNNLHKEIDVILQTTFKEAVKANKNVVIDMTNMSRKTRRKWLANVPKNYSKTAVVFAVDYEEILKRSNNRNKETGKYISPLVIKQLAKGFMVPTYDEVDKIEWIF